MAAKTFTEITLKEDNGTITTLQGEMIVIGQDSTPPVEPPIEPIPPQPGQYDFHADFDAFSRDYNMRSADDWKKLWKEAIDQGSPKVVCLEQNTDATRHDFWIRGNGPAGHNYISAFMPHDSYGMGHRSCQVWVGKPNIVNVAFKWRCPTPAGGINLWTRGGGKWGGAWQFGPIQSGATGGIRNFAIWAAGQSTLGRQDITVGLQNQPDGGQWVQPPYYAYRPIMYDHWYSIKMRMTGGTADFPKRVRCEYWKDSDPVFDYTANTTNGNAQGGKADVFWDLTCFFGGGAANSAPADCWFDFADIHIWTE